MDQLTILVGTMSGNAEMVADELKAKLCKRAIAAKIVNMAACTPAMLQREHTYIICTSTYGDGDVPDDAQPFFDALAATTPDLTGLRYGVVALGDQLYASTFCFGGKRFDELFASLGATRIGERMEHDASAGTFPDEMAAKWLVPWLEACQSGTPV